VSIVGLYDDPLRRSGLVTLTPFRRTLFVLFVGVVIQPAVWLSIAEPLGRRSKFRRGVGGPLVGGVDIMMSSDPRTVVHLACSPPLHYAFCVAKLRGCHDHDGNPYRAVRQYTGRMRGRHARARTSRSCMTARSRETSEAVFASIPARARARPRMTRRRMHD
jgi:hypothetical protein